MAIKNPKITECPEYLSRWDFEKNTDKNPKDFVIGSNKKAFWKCKFGHSYERIIQSECIRHLGCPVCSNKKLFAGVNDLQTLIPEIESWWDYDRNDLKPSQIVGFGSSRQIWLKCPLGHKFKKTPISLRGHLSCPVCANKKVEAGFNDLATTHKEILNWWDYEKNEIKPTEITSGAEKYIYFKCPEGHSFKKLLYRFVKAPACPLCNRENHVSISEVAFFYFVKKAFDDTCQSQKFDWLPNSEIDVYVPSLKLGIEYDGSNWHKSIEKDKLKDDLCFKNGITLVRVRESECPDYQSSSYKITVIDCQGNIVRLKDGINALYKFINEKYNTQIEIIDDLNQDVSEINKLFFTKTKKYLLKDVNPEVFKRWNYERNNGLNPNLISAGSNKKVWWRCEKNHEWLASISSIARNKNSGCPVCSNKVIVNGFNDLATMFPEIAKEWDYKANIGITPSNIYGKSNRKVGWICPNNHKYITSILSRTTLKTGCPYCSNVKALKGFNDLKTLYPEVAKEWDYEKNKPYLPSQYLAGSEKPVWWKCDKGHSYKKQISLRITNKIGCPYCSNRKLLKGFNDLETRYPDLAKEWDYQSNGDLKPSSVVASPGSHKRISWMCPKGHKWQTTLSERIGPHKTGCPICANEKRYTK